MSFKLKIIFIVVVSTILCTAFAVWISSAKLHDEGDLALVKKSQAILSRLEAAQSYVADQGGLQDKIDKMVGLYPDGNLPKEARLEVLKLVPVFAAMKVGEFGAEKEGYKFRVFSKEPRNPQNQATQTEEEILARFNSDANLPEIIVEDEDNVRVYRPVRLSKVQGCLSCHGDPATSPFKNGMDIVGYKMEGWVDGRLHGAIVITTSKDEFKAAARASMMQMIGFGLLISIVTAVGSVLLLRRPLATLQSIVQSLISAGEQLQSTGNSIADSSESLSASSTQAAASIQETSSSAEEVASMVKLNSTNAQSARELSKTCEIRAKEGRGEVEKLIHSMNGVAESSKKVESIVNVIDEIAFQTNLLALNAAVEAARAGDHGKGFAVVADAVRALANRSSVSAKEISDLIKQSSSAVDDSCKIAEESRVALNGIVESVEKVAQLNTEISKASTEQSQGLNNITHAVTELDSVTQKNAAAAGDTAKASKKLAEESDKLHDLVDELKSVVGGKQAA